MKRIFLIMAAILSGTVYAIGQKQDSLVKDLPSPDEMLELIDAPQKSFTGRIFFINDWDGGDKDNQNVGEELNRNSRIKEHVTVLSQFPGQKPRKIEVADLVMDARILAEASKKGKVAIAMGAHSKHALAWLTKLPFSDYNYNNIVLVSHSNWNELDGRAGYEANYQAGDPDLMDTHGEKLRRGLYSNLARIHDLGVSIWEIPRTDMGPGGWGGRLGESSKGTVVIKAFDISDLGLVHYLKTGITEATPSQRNEFVSKLMQKPEAIDDVDRSLITRYWDSNDGIPGNLEDYLPGGKSYKPSNK